jgi:hypothetical protein
MLLGISCVALVALAVFVGWEGIKVLISGRTAQEFLVETDKV